MKGSLPWIGGALIGISLCGVIAVKLIHRSESGPEPDPIYPLIAISWGTPMGQDSPWTYQVQVMAKDDDKDHVLEVSARVCIGGGGYYHDMGNLGSATDKGDAVRQFGKIDWLPDRVTIGGEGGTKATLMRKNLQSHR